MRISHRYRFIFLASPKTGSESMRAFLDPLSDVAGRPILETTDACPFYVHMRAIEVQKAFLRLGWSFDQYYRFVFVRNPWIRLVSLYNMICRLNRGFVPSFESWLRTSKPDGEGGGGRSPERWRRHGTYSLESFAGDENGNLLVDDVFRLEDIESVPGHLRERGIPIPPGAKIPWLNGVEEPIAVSRYYTP